jgi:hypothetical protein
MRSTLYCVAERPKGLSTSATSPASTSAVRITLSIASCSSESNGLAFLISLPSDITKNNTRYNDYCQDEYNGAAQVFE